MLVIEKRDGTLYSRVLERNLVRQYEFLTDSIEIVIYQGHSAFDKYFLWALNHIGVANLSQFGGRFRQEPIYIGNHTPPHFAEVPDLMDRFVSTVHENWYDWASTDLAAYVLWRLLWIHPFIEGNGRTARAACYYALCVKEGRLLPGKKIVPERIRENPQPYYAALRAADEAWRLGNLDVAELEAYLAGLLAAQLRDDN